MSIIRLKITSLRAGVFSLLLVLFQVSVIVSNAENIGKESSAKTVKILTIGNSFAENACQYLQQITKSVEGCNIIIGKANIGGCDLEKHANLIRKCEQDESLKPYKGKSLKDWLVADDWDIVTIQQVSHLSFKEESFQPHADEIYNYIKEHAPQARIYIHETWAYAPDCPRLEGFGITSKQMHKKLKKNYKALSKHYDAPMLRSGDAFYNSWKNNRTIDLWNAKDRFHASNYGCYLAGCVWFSELFDKSPAEVKFIPDGISVEAAKYLQKIAAN